MNRLFYDLIALQVQNPYANRKATEKETPIVHTPTEILELPASMRNNTICYRQGVSPRSYNDALTGTVTVKQEDGETVRLKSRTGRGELYKFQTRISLEKYIL